MGGKEGRTVIIMIVLEQNLMTIKVNQSPYFLFCFSSSIFECVSSFCEMTYPSFHHSDHQVLFESKRDCFQIACFHLSNQHLFSRVRGFID
jgi:hypothetical protein